MDIDIKPPLYAVDREQINDLLLYDNLNPLIANWLREIDHFPIIKDPYASGRTGLLLFERFSPWGTLWASDYTLKFFEFYKYLSNNQDYQHPYFNGYGLLNIDYGNMMYDFPIYSFNIETEITLSNNLPQPLYITYLKKSYVNNAVYMLHGFDNLDFFVKQLIVISPFSQRKFKTENVLFCSMVFSGEGTWTSESIGIPKKLDYNYLDDQLQEIKDIIDNEFPYLNKHIISINYQVNCKSEITHDDELRQLNIDGGYYFSWVEDSLVLADFPDWYYATALMYANNDLWETGEEIREDLGLEINVTLYGYTLEYGFLNLPPVEPITGPVIFEDIYPEELVPNITSPVTIAEFTYRSGVGVCDVSRSPYASPEYNRFGEFFSKQNTFGNLGYLQNTTEYSYGVSISALAGSNGWTNTGIVNQIRGTLFNNVSGISSVYNSLLIESFGSAGGGTGENAYNNFEKKTGSSRFIYDVTFSPLNNNLTFNKLIGEKTVNSQVVTPIYGSYLFNQFPSNSIYNVIRGREARITTEGNIPSAFLPASNVTNANYLHESILLFQPHLSDPRTIRSNTDQDIIDFVENIINEDFDENEFMPDSQRVIEIHEALNAAKFANDPNDPEVYRFANLGYYIERIARILGISVDPDGSIRSIRQRGYKEAGSTLPEGWPIGQWGRNQGGSTEGQQGGNPEDDKDGITYPVISNKFTLDPYTGEPDKIVEGGYVLCENLFQYLETLKDDIDKALGLQYAGANSFPLVQGQGEVSYEGLSILVQENAYMLSQLSRLISSAQISSLVTQAVVIELLRQCGVPTTIKELKVDVADEQTVSVPYPAITQGSPSQFDQTLWLLSNLATLLGGKINIRKDKREEEQE